MKKVKYKALILIGGEVDLGIEHIDPSIFKSILSNYLKKTLECDIKIEECQVCLED